MSSNDSPTLHIGHSPDPDDAFMWYPLADFPDGSGPGGKTYTPCIDTAGYRFIHVLEDIQSLNERSAKGELEITALSMHQYPYIADQYALTSCGSSMGEGYGPMVISTNQFSVDEIASKHIAIPGEQTTAFLALSLMLGAKPTNYTVVPFDEIIQRTVAGEFDCGLIIHEGQLTYGDAGLEKIVDLGEWWSATRDLPLPLGGNAIRRDLVDQFPTICRVLYDSIRYSLDHRAESIEYALNYARDMDTDLADEFVGMYVNEITLDYGDRGRRAVQQLMDEGAAAGLIPEVGEIDWVRPG